MRAQVWKLPFDNTDSSDILQSNSVLNAFTLQETLFVEQLTSIDERVRFQVFYTNLEKKKCPIILSLQQVPMDVVHGKSLMECAITGSPISQMTIMHAYQTCIKRIVRFANSLQVSDFLQRIGDAFQIKKIYI